jgi:hypothetical protein
MGTLMTNNSAETTRLLEQARAGDKEALNALLAEELSLAETALSLGIEEPAAAKRYIRALKRLKATLANMPGGLDSV